MLWGLSQGYSLLVWGWWWGAIRENILEEMTQVLKQQRIRWPKCGSGNQEGRESGVGYSSHPISTVIRPNTFQGDDKSWHLEGSPWPLTVLGITCILSFNLLNKPRRLALSALFSRWELRSGEVSHQRHREAKSLALSFMVSRNLNLVILAPEPQIKLCTILGSWIADKHPPCAHQAAVATWL